MAEVKVVYHCEDRKINIDVVVPVDGPIVAPFPVLPSGNWNVTWFLKGNDGNQPTFNQDGIVLAATPDGLGASPSTANESGGVSWAIDFTNACSHLHEVQYTIAGNRGDAALRDFLLEDFLHDPTISVVSDPPNG